VWRYALEVDGPVEVGFGREGCGTSRDGGFLRDAISCLIGGWVG